MRRAVKTGQSDIGACQTWAAEKKEPPVPAGYCSHCLSYPWDAQTAHFTVQCGPHITVPQSQLPHYLHCICDRLLTSLLPLSRPASLPVPELGEQVHATLAQDALAPITELPLQTASVRKYISSPTRESRDSKAQGRSETLPFPLRHLGSHGGLQAELNSQVVLARSRGCMCV